VRLELWLRNFLNGLLTSEVKKMKSSKRNLLILMIIAMLLYLYSEYKTLQQCIKEKVKSDIDYIVEDINIYVKTKKRLPSKLEDLYEDCQPMVRDFYMKDILKDVWGTPYRYEVEGKKIKITSAGRDKNFGTKDDVIVERIFRIKSFTLSNKK